MGEGEDIGPTLLHQSCRKKKKRKLTGRQKGDGGKNTQGRFLEEKKKPVRASARGKGGDPIAALQIKKVAAGARRQGETSDPVPNGKGGEKKRANVKCFVKKGGRRSLNL